MSDAYELNVIVCYDDLRAKEYLPMPAKYVGGREPVGFFYNLYCNDLLELVETPGHILFLDDDDEIIPDSIGKFMSVAKEGESYIVPFTRGDFQKPTPTQMFGHVLAQGYCGLPNMVLWSGHKDQIRFDNSELADFKALKMLPNPRWLNIPIVASRRRNRGVKEI
jgi:hypothetical protein